MPKRPGKERKPAAKRIQMNFSPLSLAFWCCGLLFLLCWVFILGILVGRGYLPEEVSNLAELKGQLASLQTMVQNRRQELESLKQQVQNPEFQFPGMLTGPPAATPGKAPPRQSPAPGTTPQGQAAEAATAYTVQLASLENGLQALKMVSQLVDRGYPAYFYAFTMKGTARYRVRCGRYATREKAQEIAAQLRKEENLAGFVTPYTEQ